MIFYGVFSITSVFVFLNDSKRWPGLIAMIIHPLMALPIAFFVFYKGYFGAVMGRGYFTFYKLSETLVVSVGYLIRICCVFLFDIFVSWSAFLDF